MGAFNLKRFSKPEALKRMHPESLRELLEPYRAYFAGRDLELPRPGEKEGFDYGLLARILVAPNADTPDELANALYIVNELSTPEGQEALEGMRGLAGVFLELGPQSTPADVAARCWVHDPRSVEQAFGETRIHQPRSFEYSQCRVWPPLPVKWTRESRSGLEEALGDWFVERRRGRGVRVLSGERDGEVWFVVRHGDPFRREGSLEEGESKSVLFRPEKYDVLVYDTDSGELRINARSKSEKELYRWAFGEHLFGLQGYFGDCGKYTLEPLRENGPSALVCSDVEGLELVVLKELALFWGGAQGEEEVRRADDLMATYERRGRGIPKRPRLRRAKFAVKFSDGGRPRVVTVVAPNRTLLMRDGDGALVEEWLIRRGFAQRREGAVDEAA
ncbi:MAG: hypothetical protein K0U98_05850 [Deltaproteobacteria bacterium]|nr:hypothetical protein [Deltaproteobacteria bacterium]